jgi:hypothetical protein
MPTTSPRHFVTESDGLAAALDAAARRLPDLSRAQLLVHLALRVTPQRQPRPRRNTRDGCSIERHSGEFTGAYGPGYLDAPRDEWPE